MRPEVVAQKNNVNHQRGEKRINFWGREDRRMQSGDGSLSSKKGISDAMYLEGREGKKKKNRIRPPSGKRGRREG